MLKVIRKRDSESLLLKCVEEDWKNSKLDKIVKSEETKTKIKDYFQSIYYKFKEWYKQSASLNPVGSVDDFR